MLYAFKRRENATWGTQLPPPRHAMAAPLEVKHMYTKELLQDMIGLGVTEISDIVSDMEANLESCDAPDVRFAEFQEHVFRLRETYRKLRRGCRRGLRTLQDENTSEECLTALLGHCAAPENGQAQDNSEAAPGESVCAPASATSKKRRTGNSEKKREARRADKESAPSWYTGIKIGQEFIDAVIGATAPPAMV